MSGYISMTIIVLEYPEIACTPDTEVLPLQVQYFRDHGRYHGLGRPYMYSYLNLKT